ncbi:MAG: uroporphyrinogen decarboxylase family protein [Anaerolineae bacterium]|nr:uroporphyrinogen decarboxylase family protein [Anaerolineae bacterium]
MQSKGQENFRRAIEFRSPFYLPTELAVDLNWLYDKDPAKQERVRALQARFPDDLLNLTSLRNLREPASVDGVLRWTDEWGVQWLDDGHGGRVASHPLLPGYETLASYVFPDPYHPDRFRQADAQLAQRNGRYARGAVWFTLFERLWMLRGFENILVDPYLYPDEFVHLRDRILEFNLILIDQWLARGVDAVFFSDDWGWQRGLLISPEDWRKFYRPAYARMFRRVRDGGAHVWLHSCGDVTDIIPDLIDLGLNVLNPVQPQAMDLEHLAREFGGKLCFCGGVDVQGLLIRGTPDEVKREVHRLVHLFGRYNGGYIGATSHSIMPETPLENVIAMYEAFAEYLA